MNGEISVTAFSEINNKFDFSRFEKLAYQKGNRDLTKKISSRPWVWKQLSQNFAVEQQIINWKLPQIYIYLRHSNILQNPQVNTLIVSDRYVKYSL